MDISFFKKSTSKTEQINMQTSHNLWNLLRARYNSIEAGQMLKNFVHDKD